MKIISRYILVFALLALFSSCKNDDSGGDIDVNTPPSQVTNINAEVIPNTAVVVISWSASVDDQGDEILYDVIINKEPVKTNLSTTTTEVDVSQFLTVTGKQPLVAKGLEVTLEIEIKAYDPSSSFSNASITKTVSINRPPTDFAFENIEFNTDTYDELSVVWSPSTDVDGDTLTYNAYLNDILLVENYEIPDGEEFGSLQYMGDFLALSNAPINVKVVVIDASGETKEISQSFDFKGTDVDLGALETPYNEEVQFTISETELDNRIGYRFSVTEYTSYSISNSENTSMLIKGIQNNTVVSGNILEGILAPGEYTAVIISRDGSQPLEGTVTFNLMHFDGTSTDIDLGILTIPSSKVLDYFIPSNEIDRKIAYKFTLTEAGNYIVRNDGDNNQEFVLVDGENMVLNEGTNSIVGEIAPGTYAIVFPNLTGENTEGTFSLTFEDNEESNVLAIPSINTWAFRTEEGYVPSEGDVARYSFTIDRPSGIFISHFGAYRHLWLRDHEDNVLHYSLASTFAFENIPAGTYHIGLGGSLLDFGLEDHDVTFVLREPTASDMDLGVLSAPLDLTNNDLPGSYGEPDFERKYRFEIVDDHVSVRLWYSGGSFSRPVELFDGNGELIHTEPVTLSPLPPGKYTMISYGIINDRESESPGGVSFFHLR